MRNRLLSLAALALAISAPAAWAQRGPGGPGRMGGPNPACREGADSLSDTQKAQVKTLGDAFVAAHKVQLDSLRAIMEAARAARQAGQTQEQVRAIMDLGMAINQELEPARKEYREAIVKLLTTSQIADGCIPPAPGSGPPGGRRGGQSSYGAPAP
jgi:Spy/CpxP family protein refolding chaperone